MHGRDLRATWSGVTRSTDTDISISIIHRVASVEQIVASLRNNPRDARFTDLAKVCDAYFGPPRQRSGSHRVYRTPWQGDPRVNIQDHRGKAKPYQVRQVLRAIEKLEATDE